MRMRRKKNLEGRLHRYGFLLIPKSPDLNFRTAANEKEYFDTEKLFGNNHPVSLEIGCGKGQFIAELARRCPEQNYIAVEKSANVIVDAAEKIEKAGLSNVILVNCGAEYLNKYLHPQSIERLYLNFSCPFPKKSYAGHRLTAGRFLNLYREFLKPGAEIHFKTDNMHFFEFSLEQFSQNGYAMKNITLDLHASDFEENIMTEYEERFVALGQPIYRLEAYFSPSENQE